MNTLESCLNKGGVIMKEKVCPLIVCNNEITDWYCFKEECGWWNKKDEECSMLSLNKNSVELSNIASSLANYCGT